MTRRSSAALALVALLLVLLGACNLVELLDDHPPAPTDGTARWVTDDVDDLDDLDDLPLHAVLPGVVLVIASLVAVIVGTERFAPPTVPIRSGSARGPPPR